MTEYEKFLEAVKPEHRDSVSEVEFQTQVKRTEFGEGFTPGGWIAQWYRYHIRQGLEHLTRGMNDFQYLAWRFSNYKPAHTWTWLLACAHLQAEQESEND